MPPIQGAPIHGTCSEHPWRPVGPKSFLFGAFLSCFLKPDR